MRDFRNLAIMTPPLGGTARAGEATSLTDAACRTLIETMSEGALLTDGTGRILAWNPSAERVLGLSGDEMADESISDRWEAVHEDGSPIDRDDFPANVAFRTGRPLTAVVMGVARRPKTTRRWLSVNARPVLDPTTGAPAAVVLTIVDVSDQRAARAESERLSLVAHRTDRAILFTDAGGSIAWVNDAFVRLTGYAATEAMGNEPGRLLQGPETDLDTVARLHNALAARERFTGEIVHYRRDGRSYWIELSVLPLRAEVDRIDGAIWVAQDITTKKVAARRLFHLSAAVEASMDGIALIDPFQDFRFANDAYAHLFGHSSGAALVGKSWRALYERSELSRFDREIFPNLYLGDRWTGEATATRLDGTTYPQELSITLLAGGSMVVVVRDITDRKAAQAAQERLTAILEATPDLIAISTVDGAVPYLNSAGRRMIGCGADEALTLRAMYPTWAHAMVQETAIPHAVRHGAWSGETALVTRDGGELPVSQVLIAHKNARGEVDYLSTIMRDITERKEAEAALQKMSLSDPLTGLYNRRGFFMLAQQHLNAARRSPGSAILMYFDLNDFKSINDAHGHATGDEALRETARILESTFRDSDIIGRLGGDEFVAMAVNCLDPTGEVLLARLDRQLNEHNACGGRKYFLSMSRGLACFDPDQPKNLQQLLEEADERLYEAKRAGKVGR